jgi:excisionase family DNA binding protein
MFNHRGIPVQRLEIIHPFKSSSNQSLVISSFEEINHTSESKVDTKSNINNQQSPSAYTVKAFCSSLSISQSFFWKLVKARKISTIRMGRRRLVTAEERHRLLLEGVV